MIALVRVDNRLLHGQIFEAWLPRLKAGSVLVVDDEAARNPLARAAMDLATPLGLSMEVRSIDEVDWAALASSLQSTVVVFRELADLERAIASGLTPQRAPVVNLGNIHFAPDRRAVTPSVFLTQREMDTVCGLARQGFRVEVRTVPAEDPIGVETLIERFRGET